MIVNAADFDFASIDKNDLLKRKRGRPKKAENARRYVNLWTAFDIETTTVEINGHPHAVMYIWQWQIGNNVTVIGRTWDEFLDFSKRLSEGLGEKVYICVWVYNLSYEQYFISGVYHFKPEDVFALKPRKILRCDMWDHLEFRCAMLQTNMGRLADFLEQMQVPTQKLTMDYSKQRFPWTPIGSDAFSAADLDYCIADVQGLVQAMQVRLGMTGDTIATCPVTSTGYVRRDLKKAMHGYNPISTQEQHPCYELYKLLRAAYRGGNTHANRYYTGKVLEHVHSADRSSSYPDVILNQKFPAGCWSYYDNCGEDELKRLMIDKGKAVVFVAIFHNLRPRDDKKYWGFPYATYDKIIRGTLETRETWTDEEGVQHHGVPFLEDNGRVISASKVGYALTDVDFKIFLSEYQWDSMDISNVWATRYGPLPDPIRETVIRYYTDKTQLKITKNDADLSDEERQQRELYYALAKALLNAIYGCMVQNNIKYNDLFTDGATDRYGRPCLWGTEQPRTYTVDGQEIKETREEFERRKLQEYQLCTPLVYSWGVWICAHARAELERALEEVWGQVEKEGKGAAVYIDTDSVKYMGDVDWSNYNAQRIKASTQSGAHAVDTAGVEHYMGVLEQETDSLYWSTLGAKKYCAIYDSDKDRAKGYPLHITIAGVNKRRGGDELARLGRERLNTGEIDSLQGLRLFASCADISNSVTFVEAGGTEIIYNDFPEVPDQVIDGHTLRITRNAVIKAGTYTLGVTEEYCDFVKSLTGYLQSDEFTV